jgi:hypothetical protein
MNVVPFKRGTLPMQLLYYSTFQNKILKGFAFLISMKFPF